MIARVNNLVHEIENLKKKNIWVTCADMSGENISKIDFKIPSAIIIGSEGFGVSDLVKKKSDFKAKILMHGKINCLNASVATGIFLYEAMRQRLV